MSEVVDSIRTSFESMWDQVIDFLPKLGGALLVILAGVIVAKLISGLVKSGLELFRSQEHVNKALNTVGIKKGSQLFVSKLVYWVVFLVFFSAAVDILELSALSDSVDRVVAFAPDLFAAAIIAGVTYIGAGILRDLVQTGLNNVDKAIARPVGLAVQVLVMIFGFATALNQVGLDLTLITANITVLIGGVTLALAIAFGLGGRDHASALLDRTFGSAKKK